VIRVEHLYHLHAGCQAALGPHIIDIGSRIGNEWLHINIVECRATRYQGEQHLIIGEAAVDDRRPQVIDLVKQLGRLQFRTTDKSFAGFLGDGNGLIGRNSRSFPLLTVIVGEQAHAIFVDEILQLHIAIKQWRCRVKQRVCLECGRSLLVIITNPSTFLLILIRQILDCLVAKLHNGIDATVDGLARLLHILDRRVGVDVLRNKDYRAVATNQLKVKMRFECLDFSDPQGLFLIGHVVTPWSLLYEDVAIAYGRVEIVTTPDIAVWLGGLLQSVANKQVRHACVAG